MASNGQKITITLFIAVNFGAIYRTTKSSYRDSPTGQSLLVLSFDHVII